MLVTFSKKEYQIEKNVLYLYNEINERLMKRDTNTLFFEGTIKGMSPVDTFSEELRGDELESYGINLDDVATILVEMSQLQHDPTDEDRDLSLDRLRVSLTNLLNDLK